MNINNEIIIRSTTGCHVVGCPIDLTTVSEQDADKIVEGAIKFFVSETGYKGKLVAFTLGNTYVVDTEDDEEEPQEDTVIDEEAVLRLIKALSTKSNSKLLEALGNITYNTNQATRNAVADVIMDNEEVLEVFMEIVNENPAAFVELVTPFLSK